MMVGPSGLPTTGRGWCIASICAQARSITSRRPEGSVFCLRSASPLTSPASGFWSATVKLGRSWFLTLAGQLLAQWAPPEGFGRPGGLALDRSGRLYVADVVKRQVVIFSPEGVLVERRGSKLEASGEFGRPLGVAIGPNDELLVLDSGNFWVEIQDARGEACSAKSARSGMSRELSPDRGGLRSIRKGWCWSAMPPLIMSRFSI